MTLANTSAFDDMKLITTVKKVYSIGSRGVPTKLSKPFFNLKN
jgi:hypothetical protein